MPTTTPLPFRVSSDGDGDGEEDMLLPPSMEIMVAPPLLPCQPAVLHVLRSEGPLLLFGGTMKR